MTPAVEVEMNRETVTGKKAVGAGDKVLANGDSVVHAYDDADAIAEEHATVHAYDKATISARAHSRVYAHDDSSIFATDDSVVFADGACHVTAEGNAVVFAVQRADVSAYDHSVVIVASGRPSIRVMAGTVKVVVLGGQPRISSTERVDAIDLVDEMVTTWRLL
jgi:hypothetical protein